MILLGALYPVADRLDYKLYGSDHLFTLKNMSSHLDGIYKFKSPVEGSEQDRFLLEYIGNKVIIVDKLQNEIAHYILLKEKENSRYLIDKELFDILFIKIE